MPTCDAQARRLLDSTCRWQMPFERGGAIAMEARRYSEGPAAEAIQQDVMQRVRGARRAGRDATARHHARGRATDDLSYERGACKRAELVGVAVRNLVFDEDVTTDELVAAVESVNGDDAVHGLVILRPLPAHIDEGARVQRACDLRTSMPAMSARSAPSSREADWGSRRARRRPASRSWTTTVSRSRASTPSSSDVAS